VSRLLRRVGRDLRARRNLDAYVVSVCALVFTVLTLVGDVVDTSTQMAVLLAGVGLLVFRITVPEPGTGRVDELLHDRTRFAAVPLDERLARAREIAVFAPSGVNLLNATVCETLRTRVLSRPDGVVRVILLDPDEAPAVEVASRQLDDGLSYQVETLLPSLRTVLARMTAMRGWNCAGSFEYRLLGYNPGFSLVAVDPRSSGGFLVVEFHGVHGHTGTRMHIELDRTSRWYDYWMDQYEHLWNAGRAPAP
jgi:hypothetical protein